MKKIITLCLVLIFTSINILLSDIGPFTPERMMTDFNGVVYNGSNILCYGNYGIITFSKDKGDHWNQLNIGDKYNIKKLRTKEKIIYGVTEYSLIKSINDGITWTNQEILNNPDIISFALSENSIYILTKYSVLKSDFNLNVETKPILEFDSKQKYIEIEENNGSIYILSDIVSKDTLVKKHIIKYEVEQQTLDTIIINQTKITKNDVVNVSNLLFNGDEIFYYKQISIANSPGVTYNDLMKSTDYGKTWFTYYHGECLVDILNDGKIFCLDYTNSQITLSELKKSKDTVNVAKRTIITDTSSLPKFEHALNLSYFKEFIKINEDTLIAVGKNKIIAISYNGGVKWNVISNQRDLFVYDDISYYSVERPPLITNSDSILYTNRYRTTNGGITWLPILTSDQEKLKHYSADFYYLDNEGTGFLSKHETDTLNTLITNNFGENYTQSKFAVPLLYNGGASLQNPGLKIKDRVLFVKNTGTDNYSNIYIFKDNYQHVDAIKLDSLLISNIVNDQNSNLYAFSIYLPNGYKDGKTWNYQMLKSSDLGNTWEKVLKDIPLESKILGEKYYYSPIKNIFSYKNYIILPNIWTEPTKFYVYDTDKLAFDSLEVPFTLSKISNAIFTYQGDFYALSSNNTFFRAKNFGSKDIKWDSVHISKYLNHWNDYKPGSDVGGRDIIYSVWTDDNQIILLTLKSTKFYYVGELITYFQSNLVRLFKEEPNSIDEIETEKVYLWCGAPYPTPSYNQVKIPIYWNSNYDFEKSEISFYDLNGDKLINPNYTIEPINIFSANIVLDCKKLKNGIYFLSVSLETESKSVKINIMK